MKVKLPSNGLLGTKWVDLREPTYGDLRRTVYSSEDEYLFKHEFVKGLCDFDDSKITMDDVQYIYQVAATAVVFNTIKIRVQCKECGEDIISEYAFGEDDIPVRTLDKDSRNCSKVIEGVEYRFNILSAKDGIDIHTYAMNETDDEQRLEEATVCKVLGYDITDENIERVRNLPVSIYVACFLYIKANKHGMEITKEIECPKCGAKKTLNLSLDSSWVKSDIPNFIAEFAKVRTAIDFQSFLKFTVPEFRNFTEYLNAETKKNNSNGKREWEVG